jgi:RND family efflux transporter MFP subunit
MAREVNQVDRFGEALGRLAQLRSFAGAEKTFWPSFLATLTGAAGARFSMLLRAGPEESPGWQRVTSWPADGLPEAAAQKFLGAAGDLAETCVQQGGAKRGFRNQKDPTLADWVIAVHLAAGDEPDAMVAAFLLSEFTDVQAEEALRRLRLLVYLPEAYRLRREVNRSEIAVGHFASVLDLVALLNAQQRFVAVGMTLCNELATRHHCDRVTLGWLEGDYIRIKAISHSERFEKKMDAVKELEAVMEEALDQDEAVVWPAPGEQRLVTREHAKFSAEDNVKYLCSVPLRLEGEPIGVLTCERSDDQPFADVEVRLLTLCSEMAVRRLGDLQKTDRWFGARWAMKAREGFASLIGPEHTGAKLIGIGVAILLAVLVFGLVDYRVDSPCALRAENAVFLSAPFNGYIDEVKVDIGDEVKQGDLLATLDTRDLLLEEAGAVADQTRYLRETEKASAADHPADMRIAQAQAEQARVRLEIVRFRRSQANIVAPFTGVVVEGDLKKRIEAPLKQGEVLFKIARIDHLYVECSVNERDVHELKVGGKGEIALSSSPHLRFPVKIARIEPAAQAADAANVFIVRCVAEGSEHAWWRPGMSGVAKLDVGSRSLLWVLTHRTVDFLRMHLWW